MLKFSRSLVLALGGLAPVIAHANLIINGSFESPTVAAGGASLYSGGQSFNTGSTGITGWTVTGPSNGDVYIFPNTMLISLPSATMNVQNGNQALDLTGDATGGVAMGVQQLFSTTPGQAYTLSFYVGEFVNQGASVQVYLNGSLFQTATNNSPTIGTTTLWEQFVYNFTATSSSTSLQFVNNSAANVSVNGLDNVDVEAATPEPASILTLTSGFALLAFGGFRRFRSGK
jgi:hypothetical protein